MCALAAPRIPRVADFDAIDVGGDVVITRRADDRAGGRVAYHPRQHVAVFLALPRVRHVLRRLVRRGHHGVPELPQPSVRCGGREGVAMRLLHRLETDAGTFENSGLKLDHAGSIPCEEDLSVVISHQSSVAVSLRSSVTTAEGCHFHLDFHPWIREAG